VEEEQRRSGSERMRWEMAKGREKGGIINGRGD
jgi:hypothetical protein